jgi:hypothetical protein
MNTTTTNTLRPFSNSNRNNINSNSYNNSSYSNNRNSNNSNNRNSNNRNSNNRNSNNRNSNNRSFSNILCSRGQNCKFHEEKRCMFFHPEEQQPSTPPTFTYRLSDFPALNSGTK